MFTLALKKRIIRSVIFLIIGGFPVICLAIIICIPFYFFRLSNSSSAAEIEEKKEQVPPKSWEGHNLGGSSGIGSWHDDKRGVTCWVFWDRGGGASHASRIRTSRTKLKK